VAQSFVGKAWNMDGCWVLASTIAAEAGASLPVQSTAIGVPGQANGEWIVAYNGPAGQTGNWQSMVTAGEIVDIGFSSGGGHITTCVSGFGSSAMLVDNATFETSSGQITNPANDGSGSDILIAAPHAASLEWSGVQASSVVIYELDTPIVSTDVASDSIACKASQSLSSLFSTADPAGKAITEYQVYDTSVSDSLSLNGALDAAHTAATAVTASALSAVALVAGASTGADTLDVRAFNGSYWGDWQTLGVSVVAAPVASPPVLARQTANQTWADGKPVVLALASNTFTDPQGEKLTYSATESNGAALPSWLAFNAATDSFSGTAPITAETIGIKVTATDTSGLATSETFSATVRASPPVLARQTANQTWTDGRTVNFLLPSGTFVDPQGEALGYLAEQISGSNVTSWLRFNSSTGDFSGLTPTTASGSVGIEVFAIDTSGLYASEKFSVTFASASSHAGTPGIGAVGLQDVPQSELFALHAT
jgi:hypothetical protein